MTKPSHEKSGISPFLLEQKFNFQLFSVVASLMFCVGALNYLVDPLWYKHGNLITGKNFSFNERISKTNLFLRNKNKGYNCLILGSSRVVALNASRLKQYKCFNYSFKGDWAPDFVNVSKFLKKESLNPKLIYVGVDEFNFIEQQDVEKKLRQQGKEEDFSKFATSSPYHAYFSFNTLLFSLKTLQEHNPDPRNYYNNNYEVVDFNPRLRYTPVFLPLKESRKCDLSTVRFYLQIRSLFPKAKIIGYVPPVSAWYVVNEVYNRNVMDCVLQGFYEIAKIYDDMYDFSVPSLLTMNPKNTYDGTHFTPQANDDVLAVLENNNNNLGLNIREYNFESYKRTYKNKLKDFLVNQGRLDLWRN